jgi:hypothetical protein
MVESWTRDEVRSFLSRTVTPIREFVRKLAYTDKASPSDLRVPPNVPDTYEENLRNQGLPALCDSAVDDRTGERVFSLKPDVKKWAIEFFESEATSRPVPLSRPAERATTERERPPAPPPAPGEPQRAEPPGEPPRPPSREWNEELIRQFLSSATPIVQEFYRGLATVESASTSSLAVPHTSPALAVRAASLKGLPPLHDAMVDPTTGARRYRLLAEARGPVATYFETNVPPPRPERSERRRRPASAPRPTAESATVGNGPPRAFVLHLDVDDDESAARLFEVIRYLNRKNREGRVFSLETDGRELVLRIR